MIRRGARVLGGLVGLVGLGLGLGLGLAGLAGCLVERATDQCTRRPPDTLTCDTVLDEVCGCDGVTYSNECVAATNGVEVAHDGACLDEVVG